MRILKEQEHKETTSTPKVKFEGNILYENFIILCRKVENRQLKLHVF